MRDFDYELQDEAIQTQIYVMQYDNEAERESNKELAALLLLLFGISKFTKKDVEKVTDSVNALYDNLIVNLEKDAKVINDFSAKRYYKTLTGNKTDAEAPVGTFLSLSTLITLANINGKTYKIRTASEIAKIRRSHILELESLLAKDLPKNEVARKLKSIENTFRARINAITDTYLSETMRTAREFVEDNVPLIFKPQYFMWVSILDSRTTFYCASQSNTVRRSRIGWVLLPPAHWKCRSNIVAVTDPARVEELRARAGIDNWLESQPDEFVKDYLGVKRYDLYKAGKIQGKDLVNALTGRRRTVDELSRL